METHKQLSKELKKTHFVLGKRGSDYSSSYNASFVNVSVSNDSQLKQVSKSSNFSLGNKSYAKETEARKRFVPYALEAQNIETKNKAELTKHHFKLGTSPTAYETTAQSIFQDFKPTQSPQKVTNQSRKDNLFLGKDKPQISSVSKAVYQPKAAQTENLSKQLNIVQRATNFSVGFSPASYQSTQKRDFTNANFGIIEKVKAPTKNQILLGTDKPQISSTSKEAFNSKPLENKFKTSEVTQKMSKAHFDLGNHKQDFKPSSHIAYEPKQSPLVKKSSFSKFKRSNIPFGTSRNYYTSVYAEKMKPQEYQVPYSPEKKEHLSSFKLGTCQEPLESVARTSYSPTGGVKASLDAQTEKNLRKSHFQIGSSGFKDFETVNKVYGKQQGRPNSLDPKRLKDIKSSHIYYGNPSAKFP